MLVLSIENCPKSLHCREERRCGLAVAFSVVELRQSNRVLVGVSKSAAVKIVLQVALDRVDHSWSVTTSLLLILRSGAVWSPVQLETVCFAQILANAKRSVY